MPVGPVGLRHGGQHLPVPAAPHSVGGRLPFPAAGGDGHGAGAQLPARPRSKVSAVEAARGGSSVTCVGRFLRQHHTEGREPPAAPATSTAASRAPGTAGPWRAGFGNSAWRRGPAHGGQTSRQSRTSRRLLRAGKLPGEIWVKPPLPVPGTAQRARRAPAGIPCPCPAATAALTSLSLPCSPRGPATPAPWAPTARLYRAALTPRLLQPCGSTDGAAFPAAEGDNGREFALFEGCRERREGFKPPGSGGFRGAGARAGQTNSISSAWLHQLSRSCCVKSQRGWSRVSLIQASPPQENGKNK